MHLTYRWRSRPNIAKLEHTIDRLQTELIKLRHEIETKQGHVGRLTILVQQRTEQIDELANVIATLRDQNRRLDEEAENYFRMLAAG
jgi:chromosome segregation ATPase